MCRAHAQYASTILDACGHARARDVYGAEHLLRLVAVTLPSLMRDAGRDDTDGAPATSPDSSGGSRARDELEALLRALVAFMLGERDELFVTFDAPAPSIALSEPTDGGDRKGKAAAAAQAKRAHGKGRTAG